ncbi:MAG: hypothetical protein ABI743_02950, partial [bacterium]
MPRSTSLVLRAGFILAATALMSLGCQQPAPNTPQTAPSLPLANAVTAIEQPAGSWTFAIDVAGMQATVIPNNRAATETDNTYLVALDHLVPASAITVTGVKRVGSVLRLSYAVKHPFNAPDVTKPASGKNRADLGFAARCVYLLDLPGSTGLQSFYDGAAVGDFRTVKNADGYIAPGALIPHVSDATVFPYQVLVDESGDGNRIDLTNLGRPIGNYAAAQGGWQRFNMGTSNPIHWTGYGFLHQGQSASKTIDLDAAAIDQATGPVDLTVHLLAKYIDPRGGADISAQRGNRLPPAIADEAKFAYRLPFAALDVERATEAFAGSGLLPNQTESWSTVAVNVVDWDARATETTEANLNDDTDVSHVPIGTSGAPTVTLDCPSLLNAAIDLTLTDDDVFYGGDSASDKGLPGDPLAYVAIVNNEKGGSGTQDPGSYTALARVTDPEAALDRSGWELSLSPALQPLDTDALPPVIYQTLSIPVGDFGVDGCPAAPKVAEDIATPPSFSETFDLNTSPADFYTSFGPLDFGSWRTADYNGILFEAYHDGIGEFTIENYDLWSINPSTGALTQLSDLGDAFKNHQLSCIDTDHTNRILFSQLGGATLFSDVNLVYDYAQAGIGYHDYSGSAFTTATSMLDTGTDRIVTFTIDADDGILAVDTDNIVHHWARNGAGYAAPQTVADLPTILGLPNTFWVCDLAIDYYNGATFLLIKKNDGGSNDGFVYRLECDATYRSTIGGHP